MFYHKLTVSFSVGAMRQQITNSAYCKRQQKTETTALWQWFLTFLGPYQIGLLDLPLTPLDYFLLGLLTLKYKLTIHKTSLQNKKSENINLQKMVNYFDNR